MREPTKRFEECLRGTPAELLALTQRRSLKGEFLFRVFFDSFVDFVDCLRLCFTPEIISAFRGEWHESNWAYVKLLIYAGLSVGSGFMTHHSLARLFS